MLLAEPHLELRGALEAALSDVFEILPSASAHGTLMGFERHRPAAVLIAMKQSEGHGLELCRRLREGQGDRRSYIVVYGTAPDLPEDVLEGDLRARFGPDRYMPRGVTIKRLDALLREQLRLGWKPMAGTSSSETPTVSETDSSGEWSHPMMSTDVVSAKNPDTSSGIFRRFWKR